jgi:O-antigen ligase
VPRVSLWINAALSLALLLFIPGIQDSFEPGKAEAVRVCGFGAVGLLLGSRALSRLRWTPLDVAVLAWLAVEALSAAFSIAPVVSLLGDPVQREGLITSAAMAALYFAMRAHLSSGGDADRTLDLVVASATAAAVYAILQALDLDPFRWRLTLAGGPGDRPFGTLGHPNLLGVVMAAATPLALASIVAGRRRGWAVAALVVLLAATLLTLSRAAWLGVAGGVLVTSVLLMRVLPARRPSRSALIGVLALLAIVAGVIAVSGRGARLVARFGELLVPLGGSGASRLEIWRTALAAWRARPLLGYGPDTFQLVFPRHQTPAYWRFEWAGSAAHAHSIYLHTLATRGVLGFAAGLAIAVCVVLAARASWRVVPAWRVRVAAVAGSLLAMAVAGPSLEALLGRNERALELAGQAARIYPDDAHVQSTLATIRLAAGDRAGAAAAFARARSGNWRGDDAARQAAAQAERTLTSH